MVWFDHGRHLQIMKSMLVFVTIHITSATEQCGRCHYVSWAYDANCKNLGLKEPPEECSEAKVLDLRYNDIYALQENAFASFTNLYHVDMENNHLTYIHPNAFVGNSQMNYIYLQENRLTNVTNMTFTGVPNLKELYLNKNQISVIEVQAFRGLRKLDVLHISNNNMSVITFDILSNLKRLRYLYMANNHLKLIQNGTFSDLENMRYLDLNFNKITIIEPNAFKGLVSLHVLKLAQNNIVSIGINALLPTHHLDILNISGNSITNVSNFTHIFQILDEFYIEDNPLVCNVDPELKPVISWYHRHNLSGISDDPVCDKPQCLKGHKIKELSYSAFWIPTCEPELLTYDLQTLQTTESNGNKTTVKFEQEQSNVMKIIFILVGFLMVPVLALFYFRKKGKKKKRMIRVVRFTKIHGQKESNGSNNSLEFNPIPCSDPHIYRPTKESDW